MAHDHLIPRYLHVGRRTHVVLQYLCLDSIRSLGLSTYLVSIYTDLVNQYLSLSTDTIRSVTLLDKGIINCTQ